MGLSGTPITPVNAFTANVYPPESGTAVLAADVEAGEQALANRTEFLRHHMGDWYVASYRYTSSPQATAPYDSFTTNSYVTGSSPYNSLATISMVSGDYVEVTCYRQFTVSALGNDTTGSLRLAAIISGTPTVCDGAELETDLVVKGAQIGQFPNVCQFFVTLTGTYSHVGPTATVTLALQGKISDTTAGNALATLHAGSFKAHHFKPIP